MPSGEITRVLERVRLGETSAVEVLVDLVYAELKKIAARQLRRERPEHTLQATDLVHETYLRLLGKQEVAWGNRAHFFAAAASAMRHILVDHARAAQAQRRGGRQSKLPLEEFQLSPIDESQLDEVLAVDAALEKLDRVSNRQKTIVEMRFYAGFTEDEIGEILQLSSRTVKREWAVARAWLHGECSPQIQQKAKQIAKPAGPC